MSDPFVALGAGVLTVSDTRSQETDTSGALVAESLARAGHRVAARSVVRDEVGAIRDALAAWIADPGIDVVVATGGTGVTARDVTPEALAPLVTKAIPGFGELFRTLSFAEIGAATIQSRAEAAVCGGTLVFLLPGSTGAVRLALERIVIPQLDRRTRPCNFAELLPRIRGEIR
jgi:molybdenum cofactor biosynthesis protein B